MSLPVEDFERLALEHFRMQSLNDFTFSGVSMGKLSNYPFFMDRNDFEKMEEGLTAEFGSFKPIKGQEVLTDSGGYSRTVTLNGVLVSESIHSIKPLEYYLKKREPIRFTTILSDITAVITNLTVTKDHFTTRGLNKVQSYNITLKEVYNEIL